MPAVFSVGPYDAEPTAQVSAILPNGQALSEWRVIWHSAR